jgi:cupin 2 domain-containing protein
MEVRNIFAGLPERPAAEEEAAVLLRTAGLTLERIVSTGQVTEWLDQESDEWVLLLKGAARLEFDGGETVALGPGDFLIIPAHRRHRVAWTDPAQPTVWLALHHGTGLPAVELPRARSGRGKTPIAKRWEG